MSVIFKHSKRKEKINRGRRVPKSVSELKGHYLTQDWDKLYFSSTENVMGRHGSLVGYKATGTKECFIFFKALLGKKASLRFIVARKTLLASTDGLLCSRGGQ